MKLTEAELSLSSSKGQVSRETPATYPSLLQTSCNFYYPLLASQLSIALTYKFNPLASDE